MPTARGFAKGKAGYKGPGLQAQLQQGLVVGGFTGNEMVTAWSKHAFALEQAIRKCFITWSAWQTPGGLNSAVLVSQRTFEMPAQLRSQPHAPR